MNYCLVHLGEETFLDATHVLEISKFYSEDINYHNNLITQKLGIWIWCHMELHNHPFNSNPLITIKVQLSIISYLWKNRKGLTIYGKSCSSNCFLFIQDCFTMQLKNKNVF